MKRLLLILLLLAGCSQAFAICAPIEALGTLQLFDNNGKPLPTGVLYSFIAGTSTQQATYTDSTCTILNNNPITMTSGGRAQIWLLGSNVYKFQACLQNDGPTCAPADVLFSVDNVPGSVAGTGSPFIGTFISGSANPATSGILELATTDTICWRNAANSANFCLSKDTSDVLSWAGGDFKMPEINCVATSAGFDYLCADTTLHRWSMFNNGGTKTQVVGAGVDINNSDQVTQLHFGAQAAPLSGTALTTGQLLQWDGAHILGGVAISNTPTTGQQLVATSTTAASWTAPANSILATSTTTATGVTIPASNTVAITKAVTFPSTGCPCRALIAYDIFFTATASGAVTFWVSDGSNTFAPSQVLTNTAGGANSSAGGSATQVSPVTYANNAAVTFTVNGNTNAAGSIVTGSTALGVTLPSYLNITILSSN